MRKALFLTLMALLAALPLRGAIPASERNALLLLYASTGGNNWRDRSNWLGEPGSECSWYGVECDDGGAHVISLSLSENNLAGPLPAELADLPHLRYLRLEFNLLTGPIPPSLGTLSALEVLDLSGNQLGGPIPAELGNLPELYSLILFGNQLTGGIPSSLAGLSNLTELDLNQNALTGEIPAELAGLANLRTLGLFHNQLTGFIPPALGGLGSLQNLYLADNLLEGPIPPELGNLAQLRELFLSHNSLTGAIPGTLSALGQLQILDLSVNSLGGLVPPSLGSLPALQSLNLSDNHLVGAIPPELAGLPSLLSLSLGVNALDGRIPAALGGMAQLEWLDLSYNRLSYLIPPELGQLAGLQMLDLAGNQLYGGIPPELGNLGSLHYLILDENLLNGTLPESLGGLAQLQRLSVAGNQFEGGIPESWYSLTALQILDLCCNNLSGPLPPDIGSLSSLVVLNLAGNRFAGPLPSELGNLPALESLVLENNSFSGGIPPELGQLLSLQELRLGGNSLTGPVPSPIGNLVNLNTLYLFGNALAGRLPDSLGNLANLYDAIGLDLNFNALYTDNPSLAAFLSAKNGMNFEETQTLAPSNLEVAEVSFNTIHLAWTPMAFQEGEGGYEILIAQMGGPFVQRKTIGTKAAADYLDCFCGIAGTVALAVRSVSEPHGMNKNRVVSEPSPAVPATPAGEPAGTVNVYFDAAHHASIFAGSPSQILPSTYLTFAVDPAAFASASPDAPVSVWISLPPGVLLSQTLADGASGTTAPLPEQGEMVWDLAVSEYILEEGRPVVAPEAASTSGIGPHAVQMLRYFEGDGVVQIRITESTAGWQPSAPGHFLGFTIGLGGGVWPPDIYSNLGEEGMQHQLPSQFYLNLLSYQLDPQNPAFPVQLCAFRQSDHTAAGVAFLPQIVSLLNVDGVLAEPPPAASLISGMVTDFASTDLDGDGLEDTCAVDAVNQRLYWAFGQPDGGFSNLGWLATPGYSPVRVDTADVTGDGRADILVADDAGNLHIFDGTDLFHGKRPLLPAKPSATLKLAGTPSDAQLADVSDDGVSDYLYTDQAAGTLNVLLGNGFSAGSTYPTGSSPEALAVGDFDGNLSLDVAVANGGADSLSVFLNSGGGSFSGSEVAGVGASPTALDAADFNQDGRTDLAVVLAGDKALGVLRAQSSGQFSAGQEQKIFFQKTPSAVQAENFDGLNGPDALVGFSDDYKLSVCTSDSTGTLATSYVIDTRGDVEVDPLTNSVTLSADRVLSLAGGTSTGGVSSRQGVATIQDQGFGVLHFPRSRDLSFSVVNLDAANALLTLELYDDQSGTPLKTATYTVSPGTQFARYLADLLGSDAGNDQRWARGFATQAATYGLWLVNNGADLTYLDGTRLMDVRDARTRFVFPVLQADAERDTRLFLVNPNKSQVQAALRLYGADGQPRGDDYHVSLAGRGRSVLDLATAFPGFLETDAIQVTADRGLCGMEMFGDDQSVACLEGLPAGADPGTLYCPHVASGDFGIEYESSLSLVNTSDTDASLALTLANDDGTALATASLDVPAHGKQRADVAALFGLQSAATGYLRIVPTAGGEGLVGSVTFGEAGAGRFLSSLPLQAVGHNRYLLGHIANGTIGSVDYFTGIAVLNPEQNVLAEATVEITAYDQNGLQQDRRTISLGGRERRVFLLHQLMPTLTSLFGGYITVENLSAGAGILVFELFGDTRLQFLSAVPAIPLD